MESATGSNISPKRHGETKLGLGNKHYRIMCVHTESVDRNGVCHRIEYYTLFRDSLQRGAAIHGKTIVRECQACPLRSWERGDLVLCHY